MKNAINWFEIPTANLDRATAFYEKVLAVRLKREVSAGTPIAIFERSEPGAVAGALSADAKRRPSSDGQIVYLDVGRDLDACVARVAAAGGRVLVPKLDLGGPGHIAVIADTEGNHVGLHSPPAR